MFEILGLLVLLAVVVAIDRGQYERRRWHRRTDPACAKYRDPRTPLGRWWHDRGRGKGCPICVPAYSPSRGWIDAVAQADVPGSFAAGIDRARRRTECRICGKTGPDCWH